MSGGSSTLDAVRSAAPIIDEHLETIERERLLPKAVTRALIDAGAFRMLVPRSLGGDELDPMTVCEVVEDLSIRDGAIGWCAMIGACNGLFGGLLPRIGAAEIYADRDVVLAGQFRPSGIAVQVDGGYSVTGRWPFASGIMHSRWLMGGCQIVEPSGTGTGAAKLMFMPREDATVLDTWHVGGLRGTGSHDFEVKDVFVPASRTVSFADPPVEPGPLYDLPSVAMFATMIASVPLGIARHAIEAFRQLGDVKKPTFSQGLLRDGAVAQSHLGEAEASLRAGRAFLFESLRSAWRIAQRGERLTWHDRGLLWLSATQAVTQALHAVDLVYRAGGAASVYTSTQLERCLRDIRAASQHVTVMTTNYEVAGQLFFGADVSRTVWSRDSKRAESLAETMVIPDASA
jgi:alkylation response protein AidB-like acyl-CoA dehydrogenase